MIILVINKILNLIINLLGSLMLKHQQRYLEKEQIRMRRYNMIIMYECKW